MKNIFFVLSFIVSFNLWANSTMLAVVNKSDNSVSIIDVNSKKIIHTLETGKGPHELALVADGKYAVSSDFVGGNSLTVFDLVNFKVQQRIDLSQYQGPHGIHVLSNEQQILVTSGPTQQLIKVDVIAGKILATVNTQKVTPHMVSAAENSDFAYVTNIRSNTISKIKIDDFSLQKQIATEEMPEAIKLSPDGKQLWYGANKSGLVTVLNSTTYEQLAQFEGFEFPYRVLFSGDGSVAMVPDFRRHNIRFFDTTTFKELGGIDLGEQAGPQGITLDEATDTVYLSLNLQNKVVAIDIHQRKIIESYPTGNNPDGIVFFNSSVNP
ncbi:YncE family protein [Glaciecola sp. 1036]|uniref:YncE family protein n=1 Tax=Alteromonadaceae TaxID=72275 RepID=UPI003D064ACB